MEWRIIPGHESYEVSEYGTVRRHKAGKGARVGKLLRPVADSAGYVMYVLAMPGHKSKRARSHRLVATAFIGEQPPGKPEVCHRDGNNRNGHWANLYWGTHVENMQDAVIHGTSAKGIRNGHAKLTDNAVREIRAQSGLGISQHAIAKQHGVSQSVISEAIRGVTWRHV